MKKNYTSPKAEKIEFDYTVVACHSGQHHPGCPHWGQQGQGQGQQGQGQGQQGQGQGKKGGSDVSNPYWECKSPNYWGC